MIRDPIFGGIDWDGVRQLAFGVLSMLAILSLGAATSGNWYDPYVWAWSVVQSNAPYFIALAMVILLGGFYWIQFEAGRL